jgi:hypothetical protein
VWYDGDVMVIIIVCRSRKMLITMQCTVCEASFDTNNPSRRTCGYASCVKIHASNARKAGRRRSYLKNEVNISYESDLEYQALARARDEEAARVKQLYETFDQERRLTSEWKDRQLRKARNMREYRARNKKEAQS